MDVRLDAMGFLKASMVKDGYIDSKLYYEYIEALHDNSNAVRQKARYTLRLFEKQFKQEYNVELEKIYIYKQIAMNYFSTKTRSIATKFRLRRYSCYYAPVDRTKVSQLRRKKKDYIENKKQKKCTDIKQLVRFSEKKVKGKKTMFYVDEVNFIVKTRPQGRKLVQEVQLSSKTAKSSRLARLKALMRCRGLTYDYDVDVSSFVAWKRYLRPRVCFEGLWAMSDKLLQYLLMREAYSVFIGGCYVHWSTRRVLKALMDCYSRETFLYVFERIEREVLEDKSGIWYYLKDYSSLINYISNYIKEGPSILYRNKELKGKGPVECKKYKWKDKDCVEDLKDKTLVCFDGMMVLEDKDERIDVKLQVDDDWLKVVKSNGSDGEVFRIYPKELEENSRRNWKNVGITWEKEDKERFSTLTPACKTVNRPMSETSLREFLNRSIPYFSQKKHIKSLIKLMS